MAVDVIVDIHKYLMKKNNTIEKCLGSLKKCFFTGLTILSSVNLLNILLSATLLKCISINNQECKVRSEIVNVNSNKPVFFPFSIKTSKCSGTCNNINDPYAKICVPDVVKNVNVKVFNLELMNQDT